MSEQWQPIETAPKDRIKMLGWSKRHGVNVGWLIHYKRPEMALPKKGWFQPTHWMPLPEPPTTTVNKTPTPRTNAVKGGTDE